MRVRHVRVHLSTNSPEMEAHRFLQFVGKLVRDRMNEVKVQVIIRQRRLMPAQHWIGVLWVRVPKSFPARMHDLMGRHPDPASVFGHGDALFKWTQGSRQCQKTLRSKPFYFTGNNFREAEIKMNSPGAQ